MTALPQTKERRQTVRTENENEESPRILDHDADGIQELDNLLPRWWVWLFYLTTIFAVAYLVYYHVAKVGQSQDEIYAVEARKGEEIKRGAMERFETSLGNLQPSGDKAVLSAGQQLFILNCAPCHRPDGGGLVGPNLTDEYWIHGGAFADNLKVIWNGVPEKGMVTWKGMLKPEQIHAVASYIYTLRGTQPPNPKPREDQQPSTPAASSYE
jgi:cytochrome c oxidase cbb3-type subunit 3